MALGIALLTGCGKREAQIFDVQGRVVAVASNKRSLTIAREEIPGYMEVMTMPFPVKEASLLEGVGEGDVIRGQSTEGWLNQLAVVQKAAPRPRLNLSKAVPIQYLLQPR